MNEYKRDGAVESREFELPKKDIETIETKIRHHEADKKIETGRGEKDDVNSAEREAVKLAERSTRLETQETVQPHEARRDTLVSRQEKDHAFKSTMESVQQQLSPAERAFSKIIHNPVIESISNAASKTVARPNAILAGSITACIVVLAVYLIARQYGYALSGAETIFAFAFGWIVGIVYDFLKAMITGSKLSQATKPLGFLYCLISGS